MDKQTQFVKRSPNLSFDDITFCVRKEKKIILDNISGSFPSGQLIGILGPSGAGKSSLLNILSGWDRHSQITGSIQVNGNERQLKDFKDISCYITQDSYLNDILTVEENLCYAADLKLGPLVSKAKKTDMIEQVLQSFGLIECRKTITSKLSGGQRKRLAICLELLSDPDIIFLDEPTTGLDFVSTIQCMKYLKNLTQQGISVVCTVHQPPDNVFELFDIVYIVAKGRCIYQGGTVELIKFLDDNGVPCGIFNSPLDSIVEFANEDYGAKIVEQMVELSQNGKNLDYMPSSNKLHQVNDAVQFKSRNIFSKWKSYSITEDFYEFRTLMKREFTKLRRDIFLTYLRVILIIFNSIMTGMLCYGIGGNATKFFFNYNMVLLQISNVAVCCSMLTAVPFSLGRNVVRHEYQNGYYSIRNYFFTVIILDIPSIFVATTVGSTLLYWLSGQLMTMDRILMFAFINFQLGMVSTAFGFLIGSIFTLTNTVFVTFSLHAPICAFSGFGMSMLDIPKYFYFLTHFAFPRYAVRTLMGVIFGYDRPLNDCPEEEFYCYYGNSKKFLDVMGLEDYYFVYDSLALVMFYFLLRLLSYFFLRYRLKNCD